MKHQSVAIKFVFVLVLVCAIITPALGLELGVNVISEDLQIVNTNPSETFELYVDDVQALTITLDRDVTAIWYEDSVKIRTDYNTSNSSYYFTSSIEGDFTVTVFCNDSLTNTSQVNASWFISVIPSAVAQPTTSRANRPLTPFIPPVEPEEDIVDEEEIEDAYVWKIPLEWRVPAIVFTYLDLWEESTRPDYINTAINDLETMVWKSPEYEIPIVTLSEYIKTEYEKSDFASIEYEMPNFQMLKTQISEIELPEELSILNEIDRVMVWLVAAFLIIFIITMKGGSGKSANPGRKEPVKI